MMQITNIILMKDNTIISLILVFDDIQLLLLSEYTITKLFGLIKIKGTDLVFLG